MADEQLHYLAGSMDSDGYISIIKTVRTVGKDYAHKPTYYYPVIGFTSISRTVPDLFCQVLGVGTVQTWQPKNPAHRRVFMWRVDNAKDGEFVCAKLWDKLVTKRRQAVLLNHFCILLQSQKAERCGVRVSAEQTDARRVYWEAVASFNEPRNRRVHNHPLVVSDEAAALIAGCLVDGFEHKHFPAALAA